MTGNRWAGLTFDFNEADAAKLRLEHRSGTFGLRPIQVAPV
jgi:hypothetical protein